jgi:MFS family permease
VLRILGPADKRFRWLWTGSVVSNLGDGCSLVAFPWLASTLTNSPLLISGVLIASRLPWGLFALPAGAVADRFDRRRLVIFSNVVRAGIGAALASAILGGVMTIAVLYVFILALGAFEVLADTASGALLPLIVADEDLESANGALFSAQSAANNLIGPPLGGALLAVAVWLPFVVDASSFVLAALTLLALGGAMRGAAAPPRADRTGTPRESWTASIAAGLRYTWRIPTMRSLALAEGLVNAAATMAISTYVLYVREILELGPRGYGLLMTAGAIGVLAGGVFAARIAKRHGTIVVIAGFFVVATLADLVPGLASSPWLLALSGAGFTFAAMSWNVVTVSLSQRLTVEEMRGRVSGVHRWFSFGLMPVGALAGGLLVDVVQPAAGREWALRAPFLAAAVIFAGCGLLFTRAFTDRMISQSRVVAGVA